MTLEEAIIGAKRKRDIYQIDTHVIKDNMGIYYSVLDFNLLLMLRNHEDKKIYYTAWNLKKYCS